MPLRAVYKKYKNKVGTEKPVALLPHMTIKALGHVCRKEFVLQYASKDI